MKTLYHWEHPLGQQFHWSFWLLSLLIAAALIWAALTNVPVYALVHGVAEPTQQPAEVRASQGGRVTQIKVKKWQPVQAGEILVVLDTVALDAREAAYKKSIQQQVIRQSQQDVNDLTDQLAFNRTALARTQTLYAIGAAPRVELENLQHEQERLQTQLRKAKSAQQVAQTQLAQLEYGQQVIIRSPVAGRALEVADLHVGQAVAAGASLLQVLPSGTPLLLRGQAAEMDRPKLKSHARVDIAWNSYPRQNYGTSGGELQAVSPTSQVLPSGQVTYEVEVKMLQQQLGDKPLLPGMQAEARVISKEKSVLKLVWDWVRGVNPWDGSA